MMRQKNRKIYLLQKNEQRVRLYQKARTETDDKRLLTEDGEAQKK